MDVAWALPAVGDLRENMAFYDAQELGLGGKFGQEVEAAIARVVRHPHAWFDLGGGFRRCQTHKFLSGICYRIHRGRIEVLAVLDLRRSPETWQTRLLELGL
ncbi:MAG: type II toxin-antitoxin system RelE/ParE family toxin [Planctomycetes bacterium]|nr:type II toxin-antitoxin system RelE/ParE family toxin [Planctomycetota bacterium]